MKVLKLILFFILAISISCKEEKPKPSIEKSAISKNVKHYICTNKCENSGSDVQGVCPTCEKPYIHNQAFHNDDLMKNGPLNVPKYNGTPAKNAPSQPSPAQNATGIYHYTCNNGHPGGSGTASNCVTCGALLTHNQAYHTN
ncbi:hypothetical protein [Lutibacter sp.]|uniref:hypothetical protein n=1 Tax=Lutibacter sp. TaxID=1925666 RepID=UPI00356945EE